MPQGAFYVMMNMEELVGRKLYGKEIKNSYTYEITGNSLKMKNVEDNNLSTYMKQ